jgi:hypothetical protein
MDDLDGLWALADTLLRYDSGGFGGLDLSRDCEDSRAPFSGDKFSAAREVAKTEGGFGFSFLEAQQGVKSARETRYYCSSCKCPSDRVTYRRMECCTPNETS